MNRLAFQRPLARFAFVAALLLALMPALSRFVESARSNDEIAALCTHAGLQQVALPHGDAATAHDDGDCAYCPLLAHGALPSTPAAFNAPLALPTLAPVSTARTIARTTSLRAAQPRGPPSLFA